MPDCDLKRPLDTVNNRSVVLLLVGMSHSFSGSDSTRNSPGEQHRQESPRAGHTSLRPLSRLNFTMRAIRREAVGVAILDLRLATRLNDCSDASLANPS